MEKKAATARRTTGVLPLLFVMLAQNGKFDGGGVFVAVQFALPGQCGAAAGANPIGKPKDFGVKPSSSFMKEVGSSG
jgi:hypothetical protein